MSTERGSPLPDGGLRVLLVGTGGGIGTTGSGPWRNGPAVVVQAGGSTLLFDAGRNVLGGLHRHGVDPASVSHLVFTHYHSDHTVGLPDLILSTWVRSGRSRWRVFGPTGARQLWGGLFGETGAFRPDIDARANGEHSRQLFEQRLGAPLEPPTADVHEVTSEGVVTEEGGWRLEASFAPDHVQPALLSVAYRVRTPTASVVITGDTGPNDAIARFAHDADLLIHDCTLASRSGTYQRAAVHTDAESLGRIAASAGVRAVVGTHVTCGRDRPEILGTFPEAVARAYSGRFEVAVDGLSVTVANGAVGFCHPASSIDALVVVEEAGREGAP